MKTDGKSMFLAQGQVRRSELNQKDLDAWNRYNGYSRGKSKTDDSERERRANANLFRSDGVGGFMFVKYDGRKYVLREDLDVVDD